MADQRLPKVGLDDGIWGDILIQYLEKEHVNSLSHDPLNGGHKKITVEAGTTGAGTAPLKFKSGPVMTAAEPGAVEFTTDALYFTITTSSVRKRVPLFTDSGSADGDILYRDSSGNFTKLATGGTGNNGKTLRVSAGLPAWSDAASVATAIKTTNWTITATDVVVFADATSGSVTITLPQATSLPGYKFYVKRIDNTYPTNTVTIVRSSTDTIDGATSQSLDLQYTSVGLVSASPANAWYIL